MSIAVCVICLTLNLLIWPQRWWSLFVLAGVGAGWATVAQAIRKRSSFCKHVLYQVVTVGIVVVLFDLMTGFGHWSFNYVIPALCVFAMVVIAIIAAMGHRSISNYIIYMVVSAVFGLIPLLFCCRAGPPSSGQLFCVLLSASSILPVLACSSVGTPGRSCTSVCTCKKTGLLPNGRSPVFLF